MKPLLIITILALCAGIFAVDYQLTVSLDNPDADYQSIKKAINHANSINDPSVYPVIFIDNGLYNRYHGNYDNETIYIERPMKIQGLDNENTIIGDHDSGHPFSTVFYVKSFLGEGHFIIKNLKFINCNKAIRVYNHLNPLIDKVQIDNCKFESCNLNINNSSEGFGASAITALGPITLKNNTFSYCTTTYDSEIPPVLNAGAVVIKNEISESGDLNNYSSVIYNNTFDHCSTENFNEIYADALCIRSVQGQNISVISNQFLNNGLNNEFSHTFKVVNENNDNFINKLKIKKNIFSNNSYNNCSHYWYGNIFLYHVKGLNADISNNTIIDGTNGINFYQSNINNSNIKNNIIENCNYGIVSITDNYNIEFCLFKDNNQNYYGNLSLSNCLYEISPQLNVDFYPIWDYSLRSRVIDAGDPSYSDPDGTIADIGALPARSHKKDDWAMVGQGEWTWLSFPVLDRWYQDGTKASFFLQDILNVYTLDEVRWYLGNGNIDKIEHDDEWTNMDYEFNSVQGYKFKSADQLQSTVIIEALGSLQSPDTIIELRGNSDENWIGYFLEDSQAPLDALAAIEDNLTYIATEDWTMVKTAYGWMGSDNRYTLNYGDMVILKCEEDCAFRWGDEHPVDPRLKATPKSFTYEEKADYLPVYVYLDEDNRDMPAEIGFYLNNECVGAAVVESEEVQINAYINDITDADEVEFVMHYNDRSQNKILNDYYSYNPQTGNFENNNLKLSADSDFYAISLNYKETNPGSQEEKVGFKLNSSYPNPFNLTKSQDNQATISFSIPEAQNVSVDIFNLKGQKIKTLVNKNLAAGTHKLNWNGKNKSGINISSGVYLYRVQAGSQTKTGKMLIVK